MADVEQVKDTEKWKQLGDEAKERTGEHKQKALDNETAAKGIVRATMRYAYRRPVERSKGD